MNGPGWRFWAFIALLFVAHFTLHLTLGLGAVAPDLLTLSVLVAAREMRAGSAAGFGFLLGLVADALSVMSFGADAASYTLVGYLGARSRDMFVGESLAFLALYFFAGKWLRDGLFLLFSGSTRQGEAIPSLLLDAPVAALYMTAVGLVLLIGYRLLDRAV